MNRIASACFILMLGISAVAQEKLAEIIWEFRSAGTLMRSQIDSENQQLLTEFPEGKPIKRIRGTDEFADATQKELDDWLATNPVAPKPEPKPEPLTLEQEIADFKARIAELETKAATTEQRVRELETKPTTETRK